jgi:hypothetical protein
MRRAVADGIAGQEANSPFLRHIFTHNQAPRQIDSTDAIEYLYLSMTYVLEGRNLRNDILLLSTGDLSL